jgi:hypothetical protein
LPNKPAQIRERNHKKFLRLDALIEREFIASNMSDAKWGKLLKLAACHAEAVPVMHYKLVNEVDVVQSFTEPFPEQVHERWFREPILYKEVEWIEFPGKYFVESNNAWVTQDLSALKADLASAARFPVQESEAGLRIVAYVRRHNNLAGRH